MGQLVLPEMPIDPRRALREPVIQSGLAVFSALLDQSRTALCGPLGRFQGARHAVLHGNEVARPFSGEAKCACRSHLLAAWKGVNWIFPRGGR